jgi:hypothetical protein
MGASSGAGKGEGASVIYNKEIGGLDKVAPTRKRNILDKSPVGSLIGKFADKNNLKRRKDFIKKEGVNLSSMDDAYILSPAGKAEINRKTGGKYDAYNEGKLSGNVGGGNDNNGGQTQTQTQSQTALLSGDTANTETISDEVITETASADTTDNLTEEQRLIRAKRANKVKTKLTQKDDELTLGTKALLS